jgi:hypothetical protein
MYAVQGSPPVTGLPGAQSSSGLPVLGSTLAAMASQIGRRCSHEAGCPPGMSEGPKRAPTSPPLTPEPKKRQRSAYCFSRRMVSVQRLLPQSTTMSSGSTPAPRSCSTTASTGAPALTRRRILRGVLSAATKSGSAAAPTSPPGVSPCPATNFSVTAVVRL